MAVICYLALGSNLENRRKNIKNAIRRISLLQETKVLKKSKFIYTDPVDGPIGQPRFLNAALKIRTALSPVSLLKSLKIIENKLGREKSVCNGPRKIDLDILLYADRAIKKKDLIIPHPRMFMREFVIKPLSEVIC
ncbi:MAG: 2-amino-4-hydroxy-6-hydroxymethyldihydropteridine diphosphokinase [Candidatus Omnitrophota bacterium]|jgi:2-amino-4-hydroxy-6-hydroxymethyldihydropteridine diphosphokinase